MLAPAPDNPHGSALFTDLYELTMAQAYDAEGMDESAVLSTPWSLRRMTSRPAW
jgi:nicotinic acid phosphoribosyltransferase